MTPSPSLSARPSPLFRILSFRTRLLAVFSGVFLLLLALVPVSAQTVWNNPGAGNWFTPGNWLPSVVPGAGTTGQINNGGTVLISSGNASSGQFTLGTFAGNSGTVTLSGPGITWTTNSNWLVVGNSGTGTLNIDSGGSVSDTYGLIGFLANSTGTATVTGPGSTWTNSSELHVGNTGTGTLNIVGGGSVSNTYGYIGVAAGSVGTATVTGAGSTWTNSQYLYVGYNGGTGTLKIESGGIVSNTQGLLGWEAGSVGTATVTGAGSTWTNSTEFFVGNYGNGALRIENGGSVSNTYGWIGNVAGSVGTATVTGANSTWTNSSWLVVGNYGNGTLSIENGGSVLNTFGLIGWNAGSTGTATVTGAGSMWTNSSELHVGNTGNGTLKIENGGIVSNTQGYIGVRDDSVGKATVTGANSIWTNSGYLWVGYFGGSNGTLKIESGGIVSNTQGLLGWEAGSVGTATVTGAGSKWKNNTDLVVGFHGNGTLNIEAGGSVSNTDGYIGQIANATGNVTVTGTNSTWTNNGVLFVGMYGNGTLKIESGGSVSNTTGLIGGYADSTWPSMGTATVTGTNSTWTMSDNLAVGFYGTGTLNIGDGGSVSNVVGYIGLGASSTGTATVAGPNSTWTNNGNLSVGYSGTGTLNIENGGRVNVAAGNLPLTLANFDDSKGTLNIGTGGEAGVLNAREVYGALGTAVLNFNHNDGAYYFTRDGTPTGIAVIITGSTKVNQQGTGTTILTGANTYTGTTTIDGGILRVNGSIISETTVNTGATLGGSGQIMRKVTVANGGILAAGNSPSIPGILTVGELILNNGSLLDFELGAPLPAGGSDLINVVDFGGSGSTGDLALDGVLNVTNAGGFGVGTYLLMNYGGTLTDQGLTLGNLLAGYTFTLVDTITTPGEVKLTVDYTDLQFWDGSGTPLTPFVDGGNGIWNAANFNWTYADGNGRTQWGDLTAVFSGSTGTVEVDGTQTIAGLHFSTDDYLLTDSNHDGALSLATGGAEFRIDADLTATFDVPLIGTGGLTKTGYGEIVLTSANTYSGQTTVRQGRLVVSGPGSISGESDMIVGSTAGDNGTLEINHGGTVSDLEGLIGYGPGSVGTATVTGAGSTWTNSYIIDVGEYGNGTLNIKNGGMVTAEFSTIGVEVGSEGTVTVTGPGSTLTINHTIVVGSAGTGTLNIEDGGVTNVYAEANSLVLGFLSFTNGTFSSGTLNIGNGGSAGILNAAEVRGGDGTAMLNFNHTDADYYFTKDGTSAGAPVHITGTTSVNHLGSGQTTLTGVNTYTGATYVNAGTLNVTGSIDYTALHLVGGNFSPGTVGTTQSITVNSLSLDGGGLLFDLAAGGDSDHITVDDGHASLNALTLFTFNNLGAENLRLYPLIDGLDAGWDLSLLRATGANGRFLLSDTELFYLFYDGSLFSGRLIENDFPTGTPLNANFLLDGPVRTGSIFRNNIVNSLLFNPGSSLQVFNNLVVTSGNFTVNSGRSVINGGHIIVPGDFNKNGGGTLVLNTFLQAGGNANINQGALYVNGTLTADRINVFHGALLGGSGVIFGDVFNSGTVAPGNSPGTLTIIGNYTQTSIGTLQIEIASEKVFDRLIVSGTARLDGTLDIRNYHGNTLSYGQQVPFLQAGKIVGTFDEILMPEADLFRGRFLNAGHTGILLVAPTSYTLVAETPNQTRVAQALDRWIGIEDGDIGGVTLALDLLTAEQYPAAFEAIMPGYYEAALSTGIELSQNQGQMLFQQLSSRRLGARTPQPAPATPVSAKGAKNVAPVQPQVAIADSTQWNGWMQGSGLFSDGGLSLNPGEDFDSGTFMVGADFAVSEHVSLGVFASYQEGWGDYNNGGNIDLESVRFGGYATYDFGGFYASGAVGGGTTDYSVKRPIQWATLDRSARSDPDGTEFFTLLGTGYDFHAGNFTFGPSLSAQYTKLKLDEFTESGADTLDLRVRDAEEESLRTYLGGRIAYTMKVNDRFTVIPELRGFWEHEFLQGGENMSASLNGGSGPEFGFVTEEPGKDAMYVGAGLNFEIGANFTTSVYYHANFGRNDDAQHTVSVSANWKF